MSIISMNFSTFTFLVKSEADIRKGGEAGVGGVALPVQKHPMGVGGWGGMSRYFY